MFSDTTNKHINIFHNRINFLVFVVDTVRPKWTKPNRHIANTIATLLHTFENS